MLFVHFSLPRYRSHPVHVTRARNHSQQHWFRGLHVNASTFGRQISEFPMFFASYCPQLGLTFPTQESTNDEKARSILLSLAIYIPWDEFRAISIVSNRIGTSVFDTWHLTRFCQNLRNSGEKVWQNWNTPKRDSAISKHVFEWCWYWIKIITNIFHLRYTHVTVMFEYKRSRYTRYTRYSY